MKTYDYINRVIITLPLTVYEGTWTHSPLLLLCITMILRVRRNFFEITTFRNSGIRARFMLGNVAEIQNFLRIAKINLWSLLATRGKECIYTLVDRERKRSRERG